MPMRHVRSIIDMKKNKFVYQAKIEYIVVYDFECTCCDKRSLKSQEVIEFPFVVIDVKKKEVMSEFQMYVKPVMDFKLTKFCTDLTGIT